VTQHGEPAAVVVSIETWRKVRQEDGAAIDAAQAAADRLVAGGTVPMSWQGTGPAGCRVGDSGSPGGGPRRAQPDRFGPGGVRYTILIEILIEPSAAKALRKLDPQNAQRLHAAAELPGENPRPPAAIPRLSSGTVVVRCTSRLTAGLLCQRDFGLKVLVIERISVSAVII
jgi:hypothetical protein